MSTSRSHFESRGYQNSRVANASGEGEPTARRCRARHSRISSLYGTTTSARTRGLKRARRRFARDARARRYDHLLAASGPQYRGGRARRVPTPFRSLRDYIGADGQCEVSLRAARAGARLPRRCAATLLLKKSISAPSLSPQSRRSEYLDRLRSSTPRGSNRRRPPYHYALARDGVASRFVSRTRRMKPCMKSS